MQDRLFNLPEPLGIPVVGETATYPIGRIFCVGRNYAAHAAEMGNKVERDAPFYFTKSAANAVLSGAHTPYPAGTENFHHEVELALAIGRPVFRATLAEAWEAIYAYGCALDMTRRDLQKHATDKQLPWDISKDVEDSGVFAPLTKASDWAPEDSKRIHLSVNGEVRQDAMLEELIWKIDEIIVHLSHYYHLRPGDLILTGTPAGVGPVLAGDVITGGVDGLEPIHLTIEAAE